MKKTNQKRWHRIFGLVLAGMMSSTLIGCNEVPAPATGEQPAVKTAPPPPGRSEKAKGKMGMPHL